MGISSRLFTKNMKNRKPRVNSARGKHVDEKFQKLKTTEENLENDLENVNSDDENKSLRDTDTSDCSDVEEEYERTPRYQKNVTVRNLLPVKSKEGLVFRSEIVEESNDEDEKINKKPKNMKDHKHTLVQKYASQRKSLNDLKRKVALLCTSLVEDPEGNVIALQELIKMLQNPTTQMIMSEKRILAVSLLHVFSDILPGYKIRDHEENETKVKLKKETRKLLAYEKNLLRYYKKYLDLLQDMIRDMKFNKHMNKMSEVKKKALREIGLVAVKCMSELLSTKFSCNYFKNIANKLVPLVSESDLEVSALCCQAFERLFKADKLGEASFELVKQIVNVIKERKFCIPGTLLRVFLSLNLKEAKPEENKIDMKKGRKEWCMMSRTERRNKKKMKELEAELKEAQAHESVENVKKFHTQTLKKIFWIYFHILKDGEKLSLLTPALEGLSKFSYLINLEFFDDLNSVLCGLMESGKLSEVDKLHSVYTLFTILAGQAESLHIDPYRIYCHLYEGLLNLNHYTDLEHFILILKCLEFNIVRKRKKISFNRILAFTKRASTISLHTPIHATLALLSTVRNILLNVKASDILLDSENSIGSGIYFPEMKDPEHCNAQSTALWELHLLKSHYNPIIKLFSQHLLHGCPGQGRMSLPDKLSKSSPEETLNLFAEVAIQNKFDFLEETEDPPPKKFKLDFDEHDFFMENNVDLDISNTDVTNVKFF